jgi:hypothetical protein
VHLPKTINSLWETRLLTEANKDDYITSQFPAMPTPKSVIHIDFKLRPLLFNPALVWAALREADDKGTIATSVVNSLITKFSNVALSIATRYTLMKVANDELNLALKTMYNILAATELTEVLDYQVAHSDELADARDVVLLKTDSLFFESRSYLELLAKFAYGILASIQKAPTPEQSLSTGKKVKLLNNNGQLITHNFLLYLWDRLNESADQLGVSDRWLSFLSGNRNLFTHSAAPYCAIEDLGDSAPQFDVLIMRTNVTNFKTANSDDYFRLSEFSAVIRGMNGLAPAMETYLVKMITKQ